MILAETGLDMSVFPTANHLASWAKLSPRIIQSGPKISSGDPTNALALEASHRRSLALAADPRSNAPVRLAASQRVARAQSFNGPRNLAHFQLFGLVTAGRDSGNRLFEHRHLAEHLRFAARVLADVGAQDTQIRLTFLEDATGPTLEQMRHDLAGLPGIQACEDPDRATGLGYYTGICFKIYTSIGGQQLEVGDGGFVQWSQLLTGNRKERQLISGFGVDRLAEALTSQPGHGESPSQQTGRAIHRS